MTISWPEIGVILVILIILFAPKKIPALIRAIKKKN
ncbi:MAG: hypothetical protein GY861_08425 [bacterium]|nr:hypothetical protein [bacterium]